MLLQLGSGRIDSVGYFPTLNGWRALALFAVIAYHSLNNGLSASSIWGRFATRGRIGVDVFFALSGFLIGSKLIGELGSTHTISLASFYVRRFFRIVPPVLIYLGVLALTTLVNWNKTEGWEFGSSLLFVRNYFPLYDGHILGIYTSQFWSLGVEEHFYLLFPLLLLVVGPGIWRIRKTILFLALAVSVWRIADAAHGWLMPFGITVQAKSDTRIDSLLWGCLAATFYPYVQARLQSTAFRRYLWMPASALAAYAIFPSDPGTDPLLRSICLPLLIISTAVAPESFLSRFLELPVMNWIGRLSYSLYIWQELFIFPSGLPHSPLRYVQQYPSNLGVLLLVACGSYYFVEKPMLRWGHSLSREMNRRSQVFSRADVAAA